MALLNGLESLINTMGFRISLEDHLLSVQMFFNVIPKRMFVDVMNDLAHRQGYGFEICLIEFPEDIEEGEEPFTGVKFSLPTEESIITNADFIKYAEMACQSHLQDHPNDKKRLLEILDCMKQNFPD